MRQDSPPPRRRSGAPSWAKELARALAERWEFLQRYLDDASGSDARAVARDRGVRLCRIAATLAGQLGPQWGEHPDDVVRLVERYAGIHSIISPGDAHSPLAYLAKALGKALNNSDAVVPWPSQVHDRAVTAAVTAAAAATHAAALENATALRTKFVDRDAAAAAARTGAQNGLAAARAIAAAARDRGVRPAWSSDPDDVARLAVARAEIAQLATASDDWPIEAQPGAGLPDDWRR